MQEHLVEHVLVGVLIVLQENLNLVIHLGPNVLAKETRCMKVSIWQP